MYRSTAAAVFRRLRWCRCRGHHHRECGCCSHHDVGGMVTPPRTTTTTIRNMITSSGRRSNRKRPVSRKEQRLRKLRERGKQQQRQGQKSDSVSVTVETNKKPGSTTSRGQHQSSASSSAAQKKLKKVFLQLPIHLLRYRSPTRTPYTREQLYAVAQRLPIWLALVGVLIVWDETSPFQLITIRGPSMIPTLNADGSDIWLVRQRRRSFFNYYFYPSHYHYNYKANDLVGFSHPDHPNHVSCKRVVGVAGDKVQRYGQYVHLYNKEQDHHDRHWGIVWPNTNEPQYTWMDKNWDDKYRNDDDDGDNEQHAAWLKDGDAERRTTIVVPDGHVWLEGDCPALAIDSRQYGPVPVEWLKGKLVARLWPIFRKEGDGDNYRHRPHPIALDDEDTLRQHNVHKRKQPAVK